MADVESILCIKVLRAARLKLLRQNLVTPRGGVIATFLCGNTLSDRTTCSVLKVQASGQTCLSPAVRQSVRYHKDLLLTESALNIFL
jgi:hypothetical protein